MQEGGVVGLVQVSFLYKLRLRGAFTESGDDSWEGRVDGFFFCALSSGRVVALVKELRRQMVFFGGVGGDLSSKILFGGVDSGVVFGVD